MFVLMRTVAATEEQFVNELAPLYDANEARLLCFLLLEDRLGWSKQDYLLRKQAPLNETDADWLTHALALLKQAKPVQYLLGYAWFMGMKLLVDESVLIPRPETEELVHLVINKHRKATNKPLRIIDIGTGSGCIAISLKKRLPHATVYALDISEEALQVARQNAQIQSAEISFIHADILEWDSVFPSDQLFDIVVSNPPYITDVERREMHQNVLAHEPHLALFVNGSAPLLFYEHIAAFASTHSHPPGDLYFEINRRYGQDVYDLLVKKGFRQITLHQDMHGADRIIHAIADND
ncbi:peptide chain release factor N(5)-glutamine methyltransferase [Parapedobacter deserti]|uniref:peptide chain release factor N(5)-glutamine methyltransferase n=1 Tax=Parapedobacter deserti TaxID=1912957 RepID=A0ABV7JDQ4_9SPHI